MSVERHPCSCTECHCSSSAAADQARCPNCSAGAHRPPKAVQRHHLAGLETWIKMLPPVTGSSGLSDAQLRNASWAWHKWHKQSACPTGWRP